MNNNLSSKILNKTKKLKEIIEKNIESIKPEDIDGIFFATEDGFTVFNYTDSKNKIKADKISAITSSLYGISNAGGQEINNAEAQTIIIEYDKSILLLISFIFENEKYLMTILTNKRLNLGKVIFTGNSFIKLLVP